MRRACALALIFGIAALALAPNTPSAGLNPSSWQAPPQASALVAPGLAAQELAAAHASLAAAQGPASSVAIAGNWTESYPSLNASSVYYGRFRPLMAYDSADGYVVLLGGFVAQFPTPATWTFDHGKWTELRARGPPGYLWSTMAYDAADREIVVFGGSAGPQGPGNLTWCFSGGNWTSLPPASTHAPPPRGHPALAYDSADGYLLMFGGEAHACSTHFHSCAFFVADTWKFSAGVWTKLHGGSAAGPPPRSYGLMADDPTLHEVVLIGGLGRFYNPPGPLTWTFHAGRWTAHNVTPPANRYGVVLAPTDCLSFDSGLGSVVLVQGGGTGAPTTETWEFNGTWKQLNLTPEPKPLVTALCTEDPGVGGLLLFGPSTWTLARGNWTPLVDSVVPLPADLSLMCYDVRDAEVVFWGWYVTSSGGSYYDQTWTYSHQKWTHLANLTSGFPYVVEGAAMTYDAADGYVLLFTGEPNQTFSFSAGHWTPRTSHVGPSPRAFGALAYDPSAGRVVLFGGNPCNIATGTQQCAGLNDTWSYRGGAWSRVAVANGTTPIGREAAVFVYDPADGYLLLFGGTECVSPYFCIGGNDTWKFHAGAWTYLPQQHAPRPFVAAAATYDGHVGAVVLFGGCQVSSSDVYSPPFSPATWTFSGGRWTRLNVTPSSAPTGRCAGLLTYLPGIGRDLLTGGGWNLFGPRDGFNDVWTLRLS